MISLSRIIFQSINFPVQNPAQFNVNREINFISVENGLARDGWTPSAKSNFIFIFFQAKSFNRPPEESSAAVFVECLRRSGINVSSNLRAAKFQPRYEFLVFSVHGWILMIPGYKSRAFFTFFHSFLKYVNVIPAKKYLFIH